MANDIGMRGDQHLDQGWGLRVRLRAAGALAAAVACLVTSAANAANYEAVYAFGDSLSDTGNFLQASGGLSPLPPYHEGRFSNGPVAVEYLADALGARLVSLAYGGATSGLTNANVTAAAGALYSTGLLSQVAAFTAAPPAQASSAQTLHVVWAGASDFQGNPLTTPPALVEAVIATAVSNLSSAVTQLYGAGARHFLLPLMPDLGATPEMRLLGSEAQVLATQISLVFDQQLAAAYHQLKAALPGSHLVVFDTFAAQQVLVDQSAALGFANTVDPCLSPEGVCADAESYLFWDLVHPTTAVSHVIGVQMAAAVPEPGAMLLMASGVVALLGLARRRQRAGA